MGYTHYWNQAKVSIDEFQPIVDDFKKILPQIEKFLCFKLADSDGTGRADIRPGLIAFNGPDNKYGDMHEGFVLTHAPEVEAWEVEYDRENGTTRVGAFGCTKTARKPYDLAVTACLIIAKHHLKDEIEVSSDGERIEWAPAILLCQDVLGYGVDFQPGRD